MIPRIARTRCAAHLWILALLAVLSMSAGLPGKALAQSTLAVAPSAEERAGDPKGGVDREARLRDALAAYAEALVEPDRDARLAGFGRAERAFGSLAADGVETAALWTNLGNAALQAEHTGRAVLAYHRALRLDPEATTARQNLAHVRSRLPVWVPRPESAEGARALLFWSTLADETRQLVLAGTFLVMCGCVFLAGRRETGAWRGIAILFGVAWSVGVAVELRGVADGGDTRAVLVADEVMARSADSGLSPLALPEPLPAGVEVDLLEERADWTRVRLANGRDVWVRASSVARVAG